VGETVNASEVAVKVAEDIFSYFFWRKHPTHDQNFKCLIDAHHSESKQNAKTKTHPTDAVFFYVDPYTGIKRYLLVDFKSYGKETISTTKIRSAIRSLSASVECARVSPDWRAVFSVDESENFDIHGFLFVYNHDNKYDGDFARAIEKTDLSSIDIAAGVYVHYLGPGDINRIYSIANDLLRLQAQKTLPEHYTFFYPDLVLWHRMGDELAQAATVETLTAPYLIIRHLHDGKKLGGYLIYYNRDGSTIEEFEYFLDSLLRYQMLDSESYIRVRIAHHATHENYKSNFMSAKQRYIKAWGFGAERQQTIENISLDKITAVTSTYSAGELGWKDKS
jgi:uncharacterized protein YqgQ